MNFARPEILAVAPVAVILLFALLQGRRRRLRKLAEIYGADAAERLMPAHAFQLQKGRLVALVVAVLAICLAAAGPGETSAGANRTVPIDIAIVVDSSISMAAADIAPARIQRVGEVVTQVANAAPQGGRLAVVVLGDWPYTLVPPTSDASIVAYFAQSFTDALIATLSSSIRTSSGDGGATLPSGIAHARAVLGAPPPGGKQVVLVMSDGAIPGETGEAVAAAADALRDSVAVWSAGVGTSAAPGVALAGRPIAQAGGAPLRAGFDAEMLQAVARAGGGSYEDVSRDAGARALISGLRALGGVSGPRDVGPERMTTWLLILAIAALALEAGVEAGRALGVRRWKKDAA